MLAGQVVLRVFDVGRSKEEKMKDTRLVPSSESPCLAGGEKGGAGAERRENEKISEKMLDEGRKAL